MALVRHLGGKATLFAAVATAPAVAALFILEIAGRVGWIDVAVVAICVYLAMFGLARLVVIDLSRLWRAVESGTAEPEPRIEALGAVARLAARRLSSDAASARSSGDALVALDHFFEILPIPLLLIAGDRRLVRINAAARHVVGRGGEGRDLAHALRVPDLIEAVDAARAGGEGTPVEFNAPGQSERVLRADFVPLDPPVAGGACLAIVLHDLTTMRRVDQMRVDFVANVSHELKTPLSSLIGFIETLRGPASRDAGARDRFLEIMEEQAARMARLIEDLMSLSRIELEVNRRPSDKVLVLPIVQHIAEALQPQASARQIRFEIRLPDGAPDIWVVGERDQITQVVQNLTDNAIKYGRPDTAIVLALDRTQDEKLGPCISFAVTDHGEGIPEDQIERLTERFYRVDTARSRQLGGTGLGLAIVKHIVNRHGGRLDIESSLGKGSTFTARFPAPDQGLATDPNSGPDSGPNSGPISGPASPDDGTESPVAAPAGVAKPS